MDEQQTGESGTVSSTAQQVRTTLADNSLSDAERAAQLAEAEQAGLWVRKHPRNVVKRVADPEKFQIEMVFTRDEVDRDGERVLPRGVEKYRELYFEQNPVVLEAHMHREFALAQTVDHTLTDAELSGIVQFAAKEYPRAMIAWNLYSADPPYQRAGSIGFIPWARSYNEEDKLPDQPGATFTEWELMEFTLCPVGSNRAALRRMYADTQDTTLKSALEHWIEQAMELPCGHKAWYDALGEVVDPCPMCEREAQQPEDADEVLQSVVVRSTEVSAALQELLTALQTKRVGGDRNLPLAAKNTRWNWNTEAQNAVLGNADDPGWRRYRRAHAWYDPDNADTKAGYKLPFACMVNGELKAVWRGVVAAMAALNSARGGVDIPDNERRNVYNFLASYYRRFDEDPPELQRTAEGDGTQKGGAMATPETQEKQSDDVLLSTLETLRQMKEQEVSTLTEKQRAENPVGKDWMLLPDTFERDIRDVRRAVYAMDTPGETSWYLVGTTADFAFCWEAYEDMLYRAEWSRDDNGQVQLGEMVGVQLSLPTPQQRAAEPEPAADDADDDTGAGAPDLSGLKATLEQLKQYL